MPKLLQSLAKSSAARLQQSWVDFRQAVRNGTIDPDRARRIFRKSYMKLGEICRRENCSLEKARTINAALEGEVNAALLRAGRPAGGAAYDSVADLLKDLKS